MDISIERIVINIPGGWMLAAFVILLIYFAKKKRFYRYITDIFKLAIGWLPRIEK
jgi:hypothetical protein